MTIANGGAKAALFGAQRRGRWALRDEFTSALGAGAVEGSAALPGPGTRAVSDTGGRLVVAGGAAWVVAGAGGVSLALGGALPREPGLVIRQIMGIDSLTGAAGCGWEATGALEGLVFDGAPGTAGLLKAAEGESLAAVVAGGRAIGACGPGVYEVATVLRSTGAWLFVRGGRWLEPTLVYASLAGAGASVAPVAVGDTGAWDTRAWGVPVGGLRAWELPSPVASDSFDRVTLGATDGLGHPELNGGAGLTWVAQVGTWGITSNKARALTVVGTQAVATVECGLADVLLEGKLETTGGWVGFTFRYIDADNYCMARITTSYLRIYKRVAGVESQVASVGITYVAGARLVVRVEGASVTAVYNSVTALSATISECVFSGGTKHGLFAGTAGSVVNVDNVVVWALGGYAGVQRVFRTSEGGLVEVYREDANNFLVTLPLAGSSDDRLRARWRLTVVAGAWFLNGAAVVDWGNREEPVVFVDNASAFEYAFRLGVTGDLEGDFDFVGCLHGHQAGTAVDFELDSGLGTVLDIAALPVGGVAYGSGLEVTQSINALYPKDGVTVAGVTILKQIFRGSGVEVQAEHTFNSAAAWEVYTHYGLMLPATELGANVGQVQGFDAEVLDANDGSWVQWGSEADWVELSSTGHGYALRATMPDGGPNTAGDWSRSGPIKLGIQDRGDGINKGYGFNITGAFESRVVVAGTVIESRTVYTVREI